MASPTATKKRTPKAAATKRAKPAPKKRAEKTRARRQPTTKPPTRRNRQIAAAALHAATQPSTSTRDYLAIAHQYATDVLSGQISACKWVRLAAKRHVHDIERSTKGWRYILDRSAAERPCRFIELLPHIKGEKAKRNETILLEPWQVFIVVSIFGWLHRETKLRRFRIVYIEVPRKAGKSTLLSAIALYMLAVDGEAGAEVYSAATTRDQARIVFRTAKAMAQKSSEFRQRFGVTVNAHNVLQERTESKFEPLSADANSLDGLNPHLAVIDELHAHKTRQVYDVIETALGGRQQPLQITITTAGTNLTGICYEVRTFTTRVLEGTVTDESFFGVVYTIDDADDWTSEATWRKANPNWGVSVYPEYIAQLAAKAMQLPAAQNNFKTKHLNVWCSVDSALFDVEDFRRCADPTLSRETYAGQTCVAGIDLANKDDIAARVDVYQELDQETKKPTFVVFGRYYLPEDAVHDGRNAQYSGWEITGRLDVTPGDVTDIQRIEDDLVTDSGDYQIAEIAFDPWQAQFLANRLAAQGATMVEVRPSVGNFSEPTKTLGVLMKERRLRHDGDPVLEWAIGNVVGHYDAKDNVYPRKQRPENKIDPVIALLMALNRWLTSEQTGDSVYDHEGIKTT